MAKKQRKNSSAGQNRWETALMQCPFEEDNWKVNVQFIVENDRLDETNIKALMDVVKTPLRKRFSYLHKNDLMKLVSEFGNPKNKKPPKVPQFSEITDVIFGLQNANQEIPLPLWAKLIKYGLINIKDEDIRKRDGGSAKEKTAKGSGKKRPRSKSPGKKGKKTPEAQIPKKDWSGLKKRGEEDKEKKYIDDEPDNGPSHYIFVSGFRKPQLLPILEELGINVNGVFRLQSENYETLRRVEKEKLQDEELDEETISQMNYQNESLTKEIALFWKLLPSLLEKAPPASRLHDCGIHEYTVRDVFYPENWLNSFQVTKYGTNIFEDIACKVYDSLDWHRQYANYLMNINLLHVAEFDKEDKPAPAVEERATPQIPAVSSQQGKRDKLKVPEAPQVAVEEMVPPITPPPKVVDTRYYDDLINSVPMESNSVSLVLHCMLEQVVATEEDKIPPNEKEIPPRSDRIHLALADCISQSLDGLYFDDAEEDALGCEFPQLKQKKEETKEKNKTPQGPVLLYYGDDVSVRTNHLKSIHDFNPQHSEFSALNQFPGARFLEEKPTKLQKIYERMARLHELHRHTSSVGENSDDNYVMSERAVDRLLELFVFESMNVATVDEDGNLLPSLSKSGNPWDDPYTNAAKKFYQEISSRQDQEKGLLESSEKVNEQDLPLKYFSQQRSLTDYVYCETFKTPVLIQMLEEARHEYPCMETYHCKRDNSTYVMFHHPMTDQFYSKSAWNTCLHSDVGFRNYLEHVADRITSWTKVQEQKFQAEQLTLELEKLAQAAAAEQTPPSTAKRPKSGKNSKKGSRKGSRKGSPSRASSKAGSTEPSIQFSTPFVRSGSLKADSEIQAKAKEEEEKMRKDKESKQSGRKTPTKDKSGKKSAGTKSPGTKTPTGKESSRKMKSGRKSPRSRSQSASSVTEVVDKTESVSQQEDTPKLPFTGYDVGNNLIHVHGDDYYLYPCDGGTVKVEKLRYEHGQTSVKTTTFKDGHMFVLNIIDPMDPKDEAELVELLNSPEMPEKMQENSEKADMESSEKQSSHADDDPADTSALNASNLLRSKKTFSDYHSMFSSWCATLCDGMTLSLSANGPDGICSSAVKAKDRMNKILSDIPPASSPTPLPPGRETPKKGKKSPKSGRSPKSKSPRAKSPKGKKGKEAEKEAEAQRLEQQRLQEELEQKLLETREAEEREKMKKKLRRPKFQHLYTSCPDGLTIRFDLDDSTLVENPDSCEDEYKLMVRQSYPYKTAGKQKTEQARLKPAMEEVSRLMLSDGRVVKIMKDGSTKILYADGTVCFNPGSGPIVMDNRVPVTPASAQSGGSNQQNQTVTDDMRGAPSAGSKRGSKGRKSSARTMEASVTETSTAGTLGVAAGLEAEAGAKLEADLEKASSWITTNMSGDVTITTPDGTVSNQRQVLSYTATDPVTKEVMITREDKVVLVKRPDGSSVCDHTDGTRITRFCKVDANEQGENSPSNVTWYIRIECPGYSSITFNSADNSCTAAFGSGSTLTSAVDGSYQLLHWNGGRLDVTNDANVMYTPRPNNDLLIAALSEVEDGEAVARKLAATKPEALGSYLMRHNADVCCEALDHEGNVFQVKSSGKVNVISSDSIKHAGEDNDDVVLPPVKIDPAQHHPPRLFIIHNDGTGTELLRYKDIQEYIGDAQFDPVTAVIREPLPEDINVTGITVMKPHFGNSGDAWMLQKEESNIVPPNLKTRDLTKFPPQEVKKVGPPFATTVGKGLSIGSAPNSVISPPAPMCPHALELRQLLQHEPISEEMRRHVTSKVFEYGKAVCEQNKLREEMKLKEPRSSEEQMRARDLLQIVLEFDEKVTPRSPDATTIPPAIVAQQNSIHSFPHVVPDKQDSPAVRIKYEATVAPHPPPPVSPPKLKLTDEDWERIKRELNEEKLGRISLRNKNVPPYFKGEEGRAWLLTQAPDLKEAQRHLVADPRKDGTEARMFDINNHAGDSARQDSVTSPPQDGSLSSRSLMNGIVSDTPSKVRPTNPTPAHASGGGTPTKLRPDNPTPFAADARQKNQRPSNPTPSHALIGVNQKLESGLQYQPSPIPENPTSADQNRHSLMMGRDRDQIISDHSFNDNSSSNMIPIDVDSDFVITKSLLYDVTGQPRKDRVRLPASILSDKPGSVANEKFINVEEEVRRKVKTSSVGSGLLRGNSKISQRGFQLFPPEVVFGVLREGTTYLSTVSLKNVGLDSCRFKIKQPPPGTGMKIHYTPGPVAAGMDVKLNVELYAIAVGVEGDSGVGTINHQLEITTEAEIIYLPITALILPAQYYDNRTDNMPSGHKAPGVRICSNKPPLQDGIVRPHKISA